jgi:uncharacterized membrane protein
MRKWSLLALAAATAAAIALSTGAAGTANAYPAKACVGTKCRKVCRQNLNDGTGNTVDYEEGTTITVNEKVTGKHIQFKCTNGNWVKVRLLVGERPFDFPRK